MFSSRFLVTAEIRHNLAVQKTVNLFEWDHIDPMLSRFTPPAGSTVVLRASRCFGGSDKCLCLVIELRRMMMTPTKKNPEYLAEKQEQLLEGCGGLNNRPWCAGLGSLLLTPGVFASQLVPGRKDF